MEAVKKDEMKRIQRKRTKGWKMPPNTVYVGRPSKWGNPFNISNTCDAKKVVAAFRSLLKSSQSKIYDRAKQENGEPNPVGGIALIIYRNRILKDLHELKGKDLACWCKPGEPCHADVLIELTKINE